jgi:hypothetical protein
MVGNGSQNFMMRKFPGIGKLESFARGKGLAEYSNAPWALAARTNRQSNELIPACSYDAAWLISEVGPPARHDEENLKTEWSGHSEKEANCQTIAAKYLLSHSKESQLQISTSTQPPAQPHLQLQPCPLSTPGNSKFQPGLLIHPRTPPSHAKPKTSMGAIPALANGTNTEHINTPEATHDPSTIHSLFNVLPSGRSAEMLEDSPAPWRQKNYRIAIMICELWIIMNVPDSVIHEESYQSEGAPKSSNPFPYKVLGIPNLEIVPESPRK